MDKTDDEIIKKEFDRRKQEWQDRGIPEFVNDDDVLLSEEKGLFLKLMDEARADERMKHLLLKPTVWIHREGKPIPRKKWEKYLIAKTKSDTTKQLFEELASLQK